MSKNIGSCGQFARIIFLVLNIFFVLVALALVGGGIYLVIVGRTYAFITGNEYASGAPILIVCGVVTLVIAIVGVIAACGLWWPLMLIYSIVILLVVILELVAGILGFVFQDQLADYYASQFNSTIYDYRVSNATDFQSDVNEFVDNVQRNFECCGVFSPEDWLDTPYFTVKGFPGSCNCTNQDCIVIESTSVFDRGCNESFFDFIQMNAAAIGGVGLSFALLEVVGVVVGFILCCCVFSKRNSEDYWTK